MLLALSILRHVELDGSADTVTLVGVALDIKNTINFMVCLRYASLLEFLHLSSACQRR
jgi:hypothetical protein